MDRRDRRDQRDQKDNFYIKVVATMGHPESVGNNTKLVTFGLVSEEELDTIEDLIQVDEKFEIYDYSSDGMIDIYPKVVSVERDSEKIKTLVEFIGDGFNNRINLIQRILRIVNVKPLQDRLAILKQSPNDDISDNAIDIQDIIYDYIAGDIEFDEAEAYIIELETINDIVLNPTRFLELENPTRQDADIGGIINAYAKQYINN